MAAPFLNQMIQMHAHSHHLPLRRPMTSLFMSDNLKQELLEKNRLLLARLPVDDPLAQELPDSVHGDRFHALYPIEAAPCSSRDSFFGYPHAVYKVTSTQDGISYSLRRLEGCRIAGEFVQAAIQPWMHFQNHPNIIALREVFSSNDFRDNGSLCFLYDYYPGAMTLQTRYFQQGHSLLPEDTLWSYLTQLTSALASIHSAGLACRTIDASRVLWTSKNRIRLNCCGILDVVQGPPQKPLPEAQYEDLVSMGRLVLSLAFMSPNISNNFNKAIEFIGSQYSPDLKKVLTFILSKPKSSMKLPTIFDVSALFHHRLLYELQHTYRHADYLEGELAKEAQNGRLFRLLVKLGFINERPEFDSDPSWSETGDRYLIKLFRDYLFHQVNDDGSPNLDFGHVVQTLNKLDVGSTEKTLLMGRNEEHLLVVSYTDIKRCIQSAAQELKSRSSSSAPSQSKRRGRSSEAKNPHASVSGSSTSAAERRSGSVSSGSVTSASTSSLLSGSAPLAHPQPTLPPSYNKKSPLFIPPASNDPMSMSMYGGSPAGLYSGSNSPYPSYPAAAAAGPSRRVTQPSQSPQSNATYGHMGAADTYDFAGDPYKRAGPGRGPHAYPSPLPPAPAHARSPAPVFAPASHVMARGAMSAYGQAGPHQMARYGYDNAYMSGDGIMYAGDGLHDELQMGMSEYDPATPLSPDY
eukprot:TRINITY_DN1158_c0_g1_i12.p1 TRINITY_DN1158_c0_g1~~TRINITY_DN1158_c0_g1_i12.p1  ORF type:complete len:691 (+),score=79.02 TRINITY_DN1158_c0_g1_i12:556-2628(+)